MKLNLGCGKDYRDGWVNVDFYDDSTCDIKHDLEIFPWPWEDDSVLEILIKLPAPIVVGNLILKKGRNNKIKSLFE